MTQVQPQFTTMQDITQILPSRILPCNVDLNTSVRRELADIVRLLFSSGKEAAVELAGRLFIDDTHAGVFMDYVYEYRDSITDIVFSQNYMGVSIEPPGELIRNYVIGINDYRDGLFINGVNLALLHVRSGVNDCYRERGGGIIIATAGDGDFREVLDYDVDVLEQEAVLSTGSKDNVSYRVQGEVVFELTRVNDEYFTALFRGQILRSIAIHMADKIMRLLVDHGFNTDAVVASDDVLILLPGALAGIFPNAPEDDKSVDRWAVERDLAGLFASILGEYFTVRDAGFGSLLISDDTATASIFIDVDNRLRDITLRVTAWGAARDTPTKRIHDRMMSELVGSVMDMLNNSERIDELMIDNHDVKVEYGLPINFEYEPELKPRMLRSLLITVSGLSEFLVTPRTVVTITHPQHGVKHLRFDDTYELRIRTTAVSDRYIENVNAVVFKRLVNELTMKAGY